MDWLIEWIRAAEAARPTCGNKPEFDALIRSQKERLDRPSPRAEEIVTNQSADEFKRKNVAKMGQRLGNQYSVLWNELAVLYFRWKEYVELFGTKPGRVELLNRAASTFFRTIQDTLWETTLLHLARLTDSPISYGRKNLTIRNLAEFIDDVNFKLEVEQLVQVALKETEFARDWRHRLSAHRDLNLALNDPSATVPTGSKAQVDAALKAIADVMNAVQGHYMDAYTPFDFGSTLNGAVTLLHLINRGLKANQAREERILKGEVLEDDLDSNL
jgi:hypothetical protein